MIMEFAVRDSHEVGGMSNIKKPVIIVLVVGQIARQINMVNPDVRSGPTLNAYSVAVVRQDLRDAQVPDNDILLLDQEAEADQLWMTQVSMELSAGNNWIRTCTRILADD